MKTASKQTKAGVVRYLHLAHNAWDPVKGRAVPTLLYGFGREGQLDREAVKRLVASLSRLLEPADALAATAGSDLVFLESRPYGVTVVLDQMWRRLGLVRIIAGLDRPGRGRPGDAAVTKRVLFALVANRALAPSSKLAAADWVTCGVHIDGLAEVDEQRCYRGMDWLHQVRERLEIAVFNQVATLLNLRSTCCSSTRHRRISNSMRQMRPSSGMRRVFLSPTPVTGMVRATSPAG